MAKAKDLSGEDIGKIITVDTTSITTNGMSAGMEGQVVGKLQAIYRPKDVDYMVLTMSGEQYAVLLSAAVFSERWIKEAL